MKYIKFLSLTLVILALFVTVGLIATKQFNIHITYAFSVMSMAVASTLLADSILKDRKGG